MRTIILLFAWLSLSASALSQNLVAYYPFNGNNNDESGNSINPTYTGTGVTLTTDRFGNPNRAYNFDGVVNSYMRMPADMMPTTNRTVSMWFNANDVNSRPTLLCYGGNGGPPGTSFFMGLNHAGSAAFYTSGHWTSNTVAYAYTSTPVNQWYHFVVTINGSTVKIFVNGVKVADVPGSFTSNTYVTGKDLALGVGTSGTGTAPYTDVNMGYLNGKLDDIRIYDAAMSDAQVMQLYNTESTGLVAYYPFNGNANDETGFGRHGTATNGAALTTDRFDNANSAYDFDGINDFIDISATGLPETNRTVMFWLNPATGNQPSFPVTYGGNGCGTSYLMGFNASNSNRYNTQGHCNSNGLATAPWTVNPENQWTHFAVTISGSTIKIFINGVESISSNVFSVPTFVNGRKLFIGALITPDGLSTYIDGSGGYFKGKLDDIKIYNTVLSNAQVAAEYSGMVAYYPFNGNANDESGNGNNGTVNGASLTSDRFNNTNKAYAFNGTSNYINVPDAATIRPGLEISLTAWVKRTRFGIDIVTEKGGDWTGGTCNYGMGLHNINNNMFYFYFNGGWRGTDGVNDLNWHHYAVVAKNGEANPVLYIDGQPKSVMYTSGAGTIVMNNSAQDLHIGAQVAYSYYGANWIDELTIYQRNLTATEVQQIYNQSATGLVAYYPFNGNANDESGNNNNGVVTGASLTTDRFGNSNKAYNFNGVNNFISVADNPDLFSDELTLSWWYKVPEYAGTRVVLGWVNGGNRYQQFFSGNSLAYFNGYYNSCCFFNPTYNNMTAVNQWQHVAVTYKKTNVNESVTSLYINGELKQTDNHAAAITYQPGSTFFIGKTHDGGYFNGELDDIRVYSRLLSPNEILQLADVPMMPDLVAYLPMNGDANDKSGNNHNGTVVNAPPATDKYDNANSAYQFNGNGTGTSITLANSTSLDFYENFSGRPFSLSAWINMGTNTNTSEPKQIIGKHNCGTPNGYILLVNNGQLGFWMSVNGTWFPLTTTERYDDGKWHHVVATYDVIYQRLYVDGELKGSMGTAYNSPAYGAPVKIGEPSPSGGCGGTGVFNGKVDEVKIYGSALDASQVTALYKQSRGSGNAISIKANDYVDIGNIAAETNITMEAWVKKNNIPGLQYFISGYDLLSYGFGVTNDNKLFLITQGSQTALSSVVDKINDGNWHHVAVANLGGLVRFYFDGRAAGNTSLNLTGLISNNYVIGSKLNFQGTSLDGAIDEVRIWNTGFTEAQIQNWMTKKLTPDHPNYNMLIRYYNFDEKNLFKMVDSKGANTGTVVNNVTLITSGASIGDASMHNIAIPWLPATLTLPTGENFSALQGAGTALGLYVYVVKDPPEIQTGILGLGSNDHYFGVKKAEDFSAGTTASYTATYNYTGNPFVSTSTELTLQLFKRADNSATTWANSGATLNTTANTLTVTGQNTEYILGSSGFGLPVTLLSFQAQKINATMAKLTWQTATELNNKGFEVQRSFDGSTFITIAFIAGAGNADVVKEYSTTDMPGKTGRVYYRLKQVDFDGNSKLSQIVSILFDKQGLIKVYPNPAQQQVTIEGIDNFNRVQLLDGSGRMVKEQLNNGQYLLTMNLGELKSGMYLLRLINGIENQTIKLMIGN